MSNSHLLDSMVNDFLRWPLPESVCADFCATQQGPGRVGTNLLSAVEAKEMFSAVVLPKIGAPSYVVTAYRWGQRNAHSYVVGAYATQAEAEYRAKEHVEYRGGKYGCEVVEAGRWSESGTADTGKQVAYVESPYYGMAGDAGHFHPADVTKSRRASEKPFTVRELQNRIGELEREIGRLTANGTQVEGIDTTN